MSANCIFAEEANIVAAFGPVDMTSAANNGDWVSLKYFDRITVVLFKAAGTAGDDPILTIRQAQDVSGTGAKALNFTRIDIKAGTLTSIGSYTTVTQAAANTYTDATHAEIAAIYQVDFQAADLDVNNGFDCVQVQVPDVGAAAQLGAAFYILRGARYVKPGHLSAIVD